MHYTQYMCNWINMHMYDIRTCIIDLMGPNKVFIPRMVIFSIRIISAKFELGLKL